MSENDRRVYQIDQARAEPLADRAELLEYVKRYTQPSPKIRQEAQDLIKWVHSRTPEKYGTALVIGRFQPLHFGHVYNWQIAGALANDLIIGIGSANAKDERNPFYVEERNDMVRDAIQEHGLTDKVKGVVYLDDKYDDDLWLAHAQSTVQESFGNVGVDLVVGNNDWVNGIYRDAGIWTESPPLLERGIYEGRKIREELKAQGFVL